ncbi:ATP-dependent DNA helicase PIF1 [Trifolium pratense]|uniref:ATP-dependent DNA helicase PIF1 n=1 Tax=Trifolium pratense TaxID=57577 RepID=A0A2K3NXT1_TRIPR|nr:ATP-dependent DNA helicase PIF1 [Trifolium pratense]
MADFSKWILSIGEGTLGGPNDGIVDIEIPPELLLTNFDDPIQAIVNSTYPNILENYLNLDYLSVRAILAAKIETVEQINEFILGLLPGEERECLSADRIDKDEINYADHYNVLTPEFLNSLRTSGVPNHRIKLKIGTPIMLMRNIDQSQGLCNGTRLIVTQLGTHVLAAKVICGQNKGLFVVDVLEQEFQPQSLPSYHSLKHIMPVNRSFNVTLTEAMATKSQLSLRKDFAACIRNSGYKSVKLYGPMGHEVNVLVVKCNPQKSWMIKFGSNWKKFVAMNHFVAGDNLNFQFINQQNSNLMKVIKIV